MRYCDLPGHHIRHAEYNNIVSFNGMGRSGKTTQSFLIHKMFPQYYIYVHSHTLRDNFGRKFYDTLERTDKQYEDHILGAAGLGWFFADFHWRMKGFLLKGNGLIFDHYLGDFFVELFPEGDIEAFHEYIRRNTGAPDFRFGTHIYLDIDYECYCKRAHREDLLSDGDLSESAEVTREIFDDRRSRYKGIAESGYLIEVDGTLPEDDVHREVKKHLTDK